MALQMTWQQKTLHLLRRKGAAPPGLKNLGNSCYLNSVLQCLTHTPPLAQFCLSSQHSSLCKARFASGDKECPFCILERQIARFFKYDGLVDSPFKLQKCLTLFAEHFRCGRQEDAHEFLRYVIDACHDTCLKRAPKAANKDSAGPSTVMSEIFGGALLSQVKCLSCKGESNKTDEIMDISLDLYQCNLLKDAIERFFQPEVLNGSNKYSCGMCKKLCEAKKQIFMLRAPNVLVIHLKRFEGSTKITRNIEFEEILGLSKFMYSTSQDSEPEYNLFGSIVHSGGSPDSGHYYAYIKDISGRWYCCNDNYVSLSSTQEVLSEKVYILFYLRTNQRPRSSKTHLISNGLKPSYSNGSNISPCPNSTDLSKPPPVKLNGAPSSKNNGSTMLKNGKRSPSPQINPITLKNLELKRVVENGKGNLVVCNDASGEKCSVPPTANNNATDVKASSDSEKHCKNQQVLEPGGIECDNLLNAEAGEDGENQVVTTVSNSASKRKLCDAERGEVKLLCCKQSNSTDDVSFTGSTNQKKHSPEEFEFKEKLGRLTYVHLQQSCDWADGVYNCMRTRKRLCIEAEGNCLDNSELRQQLIGDAKKTFTSQVPELLKAQLVEELRSFFQGKHISDA